MNGNYGNLSVKAQVISFVLALVGAAIFAFLYYR
jgi:hypothetical protein